MLIVFAAIAFGALVYFGLNYIFTRRSYKSATKIERWNATLAESKDLESRTSSGSQFTTYLRRRGWQGPATPLVIAVILIYVLVALGLSLVGFAQIPDAIVAAVLTFAIVATVNRRLFERRRDRFRRQLMQMISSLATLIQDLGTGPSRAIAQLVPQLEDPLGYEMTQVLGEVSATRDLVGSLKDLETRYPSRAFTMFIAILEMSDTVGGVSIAPALHRTAQMLARDFELTEEATAEVAQTRGEFYAVTAIIALICFILFAKSGPVNQQAYLSPLGLVAVTLVGINYLIGILRVRHALNQAKGRD